MIGFICLSTIIEGLLLPLTSSLLIFFMKEANYTTSDILCINYAHNIPYIIFAFIKIKADSQHVLTIAQIIAGVSLIIIGMQVSIFSAVFVLSFIQALIHLILISVRKYVDNNHIQSYALIATRVGIALGNLSILMKSYLAYEMIYIIYAIITLCIGIIIYNLKLPKVEFKTHKISQFKFDWIIVFSLFLRAPEEIYRIFFNIFLSNNYSYSEIGLYRILLVMPLSIAGALIAKSLLNRYSYIMILRISLLIHSIVYILHNTEYIFYVSCIEVILRSIMLTAFFVHQNAVTNDTYNYGPMIVLTSKIGTIIATKFIDFCPINAWLYVACISIILFVVSFKIVETKTQHAV